MKPSLLEYLDDYCNREIVEALLSDLQSYCPEVKNIKVENIWIEGCMD